MNLKSKNRGLKSGAAIVFALAFCSPFFLPAARAEFAPEDLYPPLAQRTASPGNTVYYVDPNLGNDTNSGLQTNLAWRTFKPVNNRLFAPGDRVEIIAPGTFYESLMPMGTGTSNNPVEIRFAAGDYELQTTNAIKLNYHISNTNDDPYHAKTIGFFFSHTGHFRVSGNGATFYARGKMMFTCLDHAEDVTFSNLNFDYRRPTVSEMTVLSANSTNAIVQVHPDSAYAIQNNSLVWVGEGWSYSVGNINATQELDPTTGRVWRRGGVLGSVTRVDELAPFQLRLTYASNPGFTAGRVLQFRNTFRDYAGTLVQRSKDIAWTNVGFFFMHGMGLVAQFSENLTFEHCNLAPRPGSGRTCACWADCLHFSGCRGKITIHNTTMAGTQDDSINVHGTHLRIVAQPATNQIQLRFMHAQTYGIEAFVPGDDIEFVRNTTLLAYATNRVQAVQVIDDKNILLTLENERPTNITLNADVIENVTWTPEVEVRNCQVLMSPTRGFLLTTRRSILIESNNFTQLNMYPLLMEDDANGWYESGCVHDFTIRGNRFIQNAQAAIKFNPAVQSGNTPVHRNITITGNFFSLPGNNAVEAHHVDTILIRSNRFSSATVPVSYQSANCINITVTNNQLNATE